MPYLPIALLLLCLSGQTVLASDAAMEMLARGNYLDATRALRAELRNAESAGDPGLTAAALAGLGRLYPNLGDNFKASEHLQRALSCLLYTARCV